RGGAAGRRFREQRHRAAGDAALLRPRGQPRRAAGRRSQEALTLRRLRLSAKPQAARRTLIMKHTNNYPKLHNAAWPGVVGKGSEGAEPFIDLDTMLDLTAQAEADGVKFDGVDLFLFAPH